ncbi:phage protein [Raoultella ornithinolytica]|uniref:phage protein n=1 Tax=Raoultella ornithinolytica TaxID=54291 RepID=UPI001BA6B3E2
MHSLHAGKSGIITVTLLKTPVNKKLSLMYKHRASPQLPGETTLLSCAISIRRHLNRTSCAFQKQPDHANARCNTVSWVFDAGKIDQLLGSFNR